MSASTSQVVCVATAWVEGRASEQEARNPPGPGTDLQFSRRALDCLLLQNLHVILKGITYTQMAVAVWAGEPVDAGVRRTGGAQLAAGLICVGTKDLDEQRASTGQMCFGTRESITISGRVANVATLTA
jgi:hypothetical protein